MSVASLRNNISQVTFAKIEQSTLKSSRSKLKFKSEDVVNEAKKKKKKKMDHVTGRGCPRHILV